MTNKPPDIYRAVFFWPLAFRGFLLAACFADCFQAAAFSYPNNHYTHKSRAFRPPPLGGFLLAVGNVKL